MAFIPPMNSQPPQTEQAQLGSQQQPPSTLNFEASTGAQIQAGKQMLMSMAAAPFAPSNTQTQQVPNPSVGGGQVLLQGKQMSDPNSIIELLNKQKQEMSASKQKKSQQEMRKQEIAKRTAELLKIKAEREKKKKLS